MKCAGLPFSKSLGLVGGALLLLQACVMAGARSPGGGGHDAGPMGSGTGSGGAASGGGTGGTGGTGAKPSGPCVGLQCQQTTCSGPSCMVMACTNGRRTTLSG